jgi:hypothetical protein
MIKLQIASIPRLPSVSRKSCPIGSGRSDSRRLDTEYVAKEANTSEYSKVVGAVEGCDLPAMRRSHPRDAVKKTPVMMAIGAARAALEVSSEIWAAESSIDKIRLGLRDGTVKTHNHTASKCPHRCGKSEHESPGVCEYISNRLVNEEGMIRTV